MGVVVGSEIGVCSSCSPGVSSVSSGSGIVAAGVGLSVTTKNQNNRTRFISRCLFACFLARVKVYGIIFFVCISGCLPKNKKVIWNIYE